MSLVNMVFTYVDKDGLEYISKDRAMAISDCVRFNFDTMFDSRTDVDEIVISVKRHVPGRVVAAPSK